MAIKKVYPPPGTRKYGTKSRYTKEDLEKALGDIKNCRKTQKGAPEVYNIPVSTLKYKLKEQHSKPVGKPPVISSKEEDSITAHIISLADLGIPVSMLDVRVIVKGFLDNEKRLIKEFKNNLPGWEWGKLFLERHPNIKPKVAHAISRKRAQVTQEMVQNYFDYLHKELQDVPPSNIFNFDETGFHDNPKKQTLLFRRSCKNPEIILNSTKSCYTVMFCCNATGEFVPLYIIFKAKQKWTSWIQGAPAGTRMAVTKSGWIDAATFEDWFEEQLLPVLQQKEGKKVLLGDNLSSHITLKTLRLCHENNIAFVCLIPNSTHLLQPLDVSYFSSLKSNWRKVLVNWRKTRPVVLEKLRNYSKPIEEVRQAVGESFKQYINEIREADLKPKLIKKFHLPVVAGKSVSVEAAEKYYQERETIAKSKANKQTSNSGVGSIPRPVKKRGRPVGAKNKAAKKVVTSIVDNPTSTSSTIPGPSSPIPTAGPSGMCMATSKDVNHDTILEFPDLSSDSILMDPIPPSISPSLCNAGVVQCQQINPPSPIEVVEIHSCNIEDIEGNYQNHDGILERVDLNEKNDANIGSVSTDKGASKVSWGKENRKQDYCVVKYEDILFPGRIICREGDTVKISVMQKSQDGWKWPLKRDLITCQQQNIVSFLDDQKIIKLKDYYLVDDPLLFMEWGD
ncbi:unnamed protein product [Euphydryas editha]|uniref:DDE-1 domain-containing protein n=1 Tax=Euphydryas editha TaxID=104508 RepID=A0AAU9VFW6_EUPED|nr:unnamed protein product [Euphydryas editha]